MKRKYFKLKPKVEIIENKQQENNKLFNLTQSNTLVNRELSEARSAYLIKVRNEYNDIYGEKGKKYYESITTDNLKPKGNKKVDSVFLDNVLMRVGIEELDRRGTISIDREEARNDIVYDLIRFINESRGTASFVSDYPENMDESHIDDLFFDSQRIIAVDEDNEIKLWAIINGERILSISSKPSENDSKLNSYTFELNRDTERYFVDRIFNSNTGKTYCAMRHRKGCNPNTIESRSIDKVIQPTSINQLMITGKGQYSK